MLIDNKNFYRLDGSFVLPHMLGGRSQALEKKLTDLTNIDRQVAVAPDIRLDLHLEFGRGVVELDSTLLQGVVTTHCAWQSRPCSTPSRFCAQAITGR
jgi:hypothetical protein